MVKMTENVLTDNEKADLAFDLHKHFLREAVSFFMQRSELQGRMTTPKDMYEIFGSSLAATVCHISSAYHPKGLGAGVDEFIERMEGAITEIAMTKLFEEAGIKIPK